MNREAINYVKEAEARVEELKLNAEKEIKEIELRKAQEVEQAATITEKEVNTYRQEQNQQIKEALESEKLKLESEVQLETENFQKVYIEKKDMLANRIAKEVLRRYGNS